MYNSVVVFCSGWTAGASPDEAQLKTLGDQMSADIFGVEGIVYTSEKSIGLYVTTGTASDWFYSDDANKNNDYRAAGFTIELRDTGHYGFELPPNQVFLYDVGTIHGRNNPLQHYCRLFLMEKNWFLL